MKRKLLVYKLSVMVMLLFMGLYSYAQTNLIISAVADPNDHYDGRYVQLFNPTSQDIDLAAGNWYLVKQVNGGSYYDVQLTGTIAAGDVFVIAGYSVFSTYYGFDANMTSSQISGNGDDGYYLYQGGGYASGTLVDAYGVMDVDGSGEAWEYLDGKAVRNSDIGTPNTTWTASEWTITRPADVADMDPGQHTYNPGGDVTAPTWTTGYPQAIHVEDTRGTLLVNIDEPGKVYFIIVPAGSDAPTAAEVKAGVDYGSVTVLATDTIDVAAGSTTVPYELTGAQPNTSADIWFVAEDNAGNLQADPVKLTVTTTAARSLAIDNPQANTSFNVGDLLVIEWTSANIDSLIIGVYPVSAGISQAFVVSDGAVAAADGSYTLEIPHSAEAGDMGLVLWDYYDTTFKQIVVPITVVDNRSLTLVQPEDGDTVYVGDTLTFRWTSSNIDSVLIGGYIAGDNGPDGGYFMLTGDPDHYDQNSFHPVPAGLGVWKMYLDPNDVGGSIRIDSIFIFDAADMNFRDYASPVYLLDTTPMHITNSMPTFGMTDFMANNGIYCDFNCDSIIPGTGQLHLKKADGTTVMDLDASLVQIHGSSLWFMPNPALIPGESYYIEIDSGFVKCADGSKTYPGLKGNAWNFSIVSSSLYFSEYIEGSSNNKALEIYNPTDHDINLDDYMIAGSYNGNGINEDNDMYHFPEGYVLHPGDVFVLANASAVSDILKVADDTLAYNEGGYVCSFNGDDARVLIRKVGDYDWLWIDQIGNPWEDPGTGWDVAGETAGTYNHTLLRKASVKMGTTDWGASAGWDAESSQWIVEPQDYFDNLGQPTPAGNDQAEITGFTLLDLNHENVTLNTFFDNTNDSVFIEVLAGTDVTQVVADIQVSEGAEIQPKSGDTLDFTLPLNFTVISENQMNTKIWTVKVTVAAAFSSEANITGFVIPNSVGDAVIDPGTHSISVVMPFGTDLTSLAPEITVSAGASVSPASGDAVDFTNPVVYTVTAQDGSTVDWTVSVTTKTVDYVTIHDIQYADNSTGDSPYKGQLVRTSGVVTALNVYNGERKGYFIEDKEEAWNGVYVYDTDTANHMAIGDSVEVVGTVDEYYNFTEIKELKYFENFGSGYDRMAVTVTTGSYNDEQWEGVLVKFENATCTNPELNNYGEVEVNDGSGPAILDDYLFKYPAFTLNDVYTVTGVVNYSYGAFKLNPRDANDITNVTGISNNSLAENISVYPNPGNGQLSISLNNALSGDVTVRIMDITGREVYRHVFSNVMNQVLPVDISNEPSNLYFISISDAHNTVVKKFMKR